MNRKERRTAAAMQRKDKTNHNNSPEAFGENAWDDLNRIYYECIALSVTPAQLLPLLRDAELINKIQDKKTLIEASKVLTTDVVTYKERLQEIHSGHAGRTGSCSSPDELMECLAIGEQYQEWLYSYQTVVCPTEIVLMDLFRHAGKDPNDNIPLSPLEGEFIPANSRI